MEKITFDKLLLKTAFCCMACDGDIDDREVTTIRSLCEKSDFFYDKNFNDDINQLVDQINREGKEFIVNYFRRLDDTTLSEPEELTLIDFAVNTIFADEKVEYSEVKFFKNIRHRLKVSDEKILETHPEIEYWLEKDISTESSLDKITKQYMDIADIHEFRLIDFNSQQLKTAINNDHKN